MFYVATVCVTSLYFDLEKKQPKKNKKKQKKKKTKQKKRTIQDYSDTTMTVTALCDHQYQYCYCCSLRYFSLCIILRSRKNADHKISLLMGKLFTSSLHSWMAQEMWFLLGKRSHPLGYLELIPRKPQGLILFFYHIITAWNLDVLQQLPLWKMISASFVAHMAGPLHIFISKTFLSALQMSHSQHIRYTGFKLYCQV